MPGLTLTAVLKIPPSGVAQFQDYETKVLALLADHGGTLERRLRNADGTVEVHILTFPSAKAFNAYRADPQRAAAAGLLAQSGATAEVFEMTDVETP